MVRLTDRPDMTLDVYRGRKTTIQQYNTLEKSLAFSALGSMSVKYFGKCQCSNDLRVRT